MRQYILKALDRKDFVEAQRGITDYAKIEKMNCVQEQFVEVMRYILMQLQGASREELFSVIEHAISLTVPDIDAALDRAHLLADQEINLIIEYTSLKHYSDDMAEELEWKLGQYEKMLSFVEKSYMDNIGKSKILPRIACNVSKLVLEYNGTLEQKKRAIELCDNAVEELRCANRLFYFVEVLESYCALLSDVKPYRYKKLLKRNIEWIDMFKELYAEYEVSAYTETFCYLYWESECHNIVDILEVRRGMTGLSRVKLSDNICAEKTIIRYERYGVSPSLVIVRDLFEKMGLCAEYKRARVITSDPEALYLSNHLADDVNNYNVEAGKHKIEELKEKLNMNISFNRQEIFMMETILKQMGRELNEEEIYLNFYNALEDTIKFQNVERTVKKYLTRSELSCMFNLAFETKGDKTTYCREYIEILCQKALTRELRAGRVPVYELLASGVADYLGDQGKSDESIFLNSKMLRECLRHRRMFSLARILYDNLWNEQAIAKETDKELDITHVRKMLQKCILLSDINNRTHLVTFFQQKLNDM